MKKNKKIIVSIVSVATLVLNLFLPATAAAYTISLPSLTSGGSVDIDVNDILQETNTTGVSSVSSLLEDRFGINNDIWETAQRKTSAPRAEIFFDNTNPKAGEKVTAHAIPEYFKNDPQNLYYTWYIIHTSDGTSKTATNSIESGKKEAARIVARGDYDPDLDGQTYSDPSKDPDSDGWPTVDSNSYDENTSAAPMGGADGVGGLAKDSDNLDPSLSTYCGSQATSASCNLYTDKSSFNSYYQFSGAQSNSYCSTCSSQTLSWGTLSSDNQCCYLIDNPSDTEYASYDISTAYCPTAYNSAYEGCFDYAALQSTNQSAINSCLSLYYTACTDDYDANHVSSTVSGDNSEDFSRCFKHNFGTNSNASGYQGYEGSSDSYGNDDSGLDFDVTCKHKWPNASDYKSGSGKFPTGEEEYWKTDPVDPDTDGDGFVDGSDVIGLGQQDFTWTYQTGDRVGVVVEGTSMIPTDEKNSYYKIMWGYPDVCDNTKAGLLDNDECDGSDDYGFGFLATKAPSESGDEKLKVSLSFSPDDPVADPSDDNSDNISSDGSISDADKITVTSSLDNTSLDPSTLYYTWQIQKGTIGDEDSWKELKPLADYFDTTTGASGLGLSSISFTPKTDALKGNDDIVNFKVTLTVSRSSGTETGRGRSSVTVPVNKKGIKLKFFKVDVDESGKAELGDEICKDGLYKTLCPVVEGQVVAAKVSGSYTSSNSDFSWSINETAYPVPTGLSDSFDEWSDTRVFFPVTQSEKDTPSVVVTATPKDSLQPVTGTRLLTVVAPAAFINSSDTSSSWLKTYEDADGQTVESSGFFEASADTEVSYNLDFVPDYLLDSDSNTTIDWQIDGVSIDSADFSEDDLGISGTTTEDSGQTIKFTTGSTETSHTLGVTVKKYWSTDEKNLIYSTWGITPNSLSDEASVSVETVTSEDVVGAANTPSQILASIGTHLPHYFMYLLRLVLTMAVMFVVSAGFYGVSQRLNLADDEK